MKFFARTIKSFQKVSKIVSFNPYDYDNYNNHDISTYFMNELS